MGGAQREGTLGDQNGDIAVEFQGRSQTMEDGTIWGRGEKEKKRIHLEGGLIPREAATSGMT